jgi:hypothetical protein
MTSNKQIFLNLCKQYNLQVSHSIINPDTLVSLQPNLAQNSYLLLYYPHSDRLNMAKEIHFIPCHNKIRYIDVQPFNQKKFEHLLNEYNQFVIKLKKNLIQTKLDRINQDFI